MTQDTKPEQSKDVAEELRPIHRDTPSIVNEFIRRVNVHAPGKQNGHRTQQIDIEYNFIGELPDLPQRAMSA